MAYIRLMLKYAMGVSITGMVKCQHALYVGVCYAGENDGGGHPLSEKYFQRFNQPVILILGLLVSCTSCSSSLLLKKTVLPLLGSTCCASPLAW